MKKTCFYVILGAALSLTACSDDDVKDGNPSPEPPAELPDWYYTGGELGTTSNSTSTAFEDPTAVVEADATMNAAFNRGEQFFADATMNAAFNRGEQFFEKPFTANFDGMRHGLGPLYIRSSCIHCHPGYGHGKSQNSGTFTPTR